MRISKQPQERRAELIAAARTLFDKHGVGKTRVSDIVKEVGVAQGVFYYYFKSKDEIVDEIIAQVTSEVEEKLHRIWQSTQSSIYEKFSQFIELYLDVVDQFTADDAAQLPLLGEEELGADFLAGGCGSLLLAWQDKLIGRGVQEGAITIRYPQETARVLLYGLRSYAAGQALSRSMLYTLVEQGLGFPEGALTQYCPPAAKQHKNNRSSACPTQA